MTEWNEFARLAPQRFTLNLCVCNLVAADDEDDDDAG